MKRENGIIKSFDRVSEDRIDFTLISQDQKELHFTLLNGTIEMINCIEVDNEVTLLHYQGPGRNEVIDIETIFSSIEE